MSVTTQDNKNKNPHFDINDKIKLNYFPNDQKKHIDYVIQFKDGPGTDPDQNPEYRRIRQKFINQLIENEKFEIETIVKKKDHPQNTKSTYLLLNCPLERLMAEAERMKMEIPLKNVNFIFLSNFGL